MVSVIIPAFNASRFIAETMESVIAQSYRELEVIVVDDGSTDETAVIVQAFAERDPRVKYVRQKNAGVAAARNCGIHLSMGEFIAPLDADDIWYPDKIAAQIRRFEEVDPRTALVYAWSAKIDENTVLTGGVTKATNECAVFEDMLFGNIVGNASVPLMRRECFDKVGFYGEEFFTRNAQGCEDGDLYLRIAEQYYFAVVRRILVGYRDTPEGMSKQHRCMRRSNDIRKERLKNRQSRGIPSRSFRSSDAFFLIYLQRKAWEKGDLLASLHYILASAIREPAFLRFSYFYRLIRSRIVLLVLAFSPKSISGRLRRIKHTGDVHREYDIAELQKRAEEFQMDRHSSFERLRQDRIRFVRQYWSERNPKDVSTGTRSIEAQP